MNPSLALPGPVAMETSTEGVLGNEALQSAAKATQKNNNKNNVEAQRLTSEARRERRLSGWSNGGLLSCSFSK